MDCHCGGRLIVVVADDAGEVRVDRWRDDMALQIRDLMRRGRPFDKSEED